MICKNTNEKLYGHFEVKVTVQVSYYLLTSAGIKAL